MAIDQILENGNVRIYRGRISVNREYWENIKRDFHEKMGDEGITLKRPSEQDYVWGMRYSGLR